MSKDESELSEYIDRLNAEKKPREHGPSEVSGETEKLFETVRLVRSLKGPAMPDKGYPERLARNIEEQLERGKPAGRFRRLWLMGAAAAAVIVMAFILNFIAPFSNTGIVNAMEQSYKEVKAYHGILEIVETNAEGTPSVQGKLEVWADKEGRYFVRELEGSQTGLVTVNNGEKKWQLQPDQKKAYIFSPFPDPYRFTFELGKEVKDVRNALKYSVIDEETVSGKNASVLEVTPRGGLPYRLWVDKETGLPLQKQSAMQNALQYKVTYTGIDFIESIPGELITYALPGGFEEVDTNPEQAVTNLEEARGIVGFDPIMPVTVPEGYGSARIAVDPMAKIVKLYFSSQDKTKSVVIFQGKSSSGFIPSSTAELGKVGGSTAEIQSPVRESLGILGGGSNAGVTDTAAVRWQQDGFEYAVASNAPLEKIGEFIKSLGLGELQVSPDIGELSPKPQVEVPVDMTAEENDQKSVDAGHSPWKLDPVFVAQVFASLKISPEGIQGDYPIKQEDLKILVNDGKTAIVGVSGDKTTISKVYLKRLVRQDTTGIWTVVGYDPIN